MDLPFVGYVYIFIRLYKNIRKHVPWRSLCFFLGRISLWKDLVQQGLVLKWMRYLAAESKSWMIVWCIGVSKIDGLKVGYLLGFCWDVHECHHA